MGAVKTFRVKQDEPVENIPFEIEFSPRDPEGEPRVETFEAYGRQPAGATLALASIPRYDRRGNQRPDLNGMMAFFELMMPAADYERFRSLLDDHDWLVELDTVGDVFSWLIEETAGRPTRRSRRASRSRPDDGRNEPAAVIELHDGAIEETSST